MSDEHRNGTAHPSAGAVNGTLPGVDRARNGAADAERATGSARPDEGDGDPAAGGGENGRREHGSGRNGPRPDRSDDDGRRDDSRRGDVVGLEADEGTDSGFGLASLLESLLFVADRPVTVAELSKAMDVPRSRVESTLDALGRDLTFRGVRIQRDGGAVQMVSAPEAAGTIQRFLGLEASAKLSTAALETLAIVAYEQPVTRPEIDAYRGVNSDGVLRTLMSRGLVEEVGRRETVGYPIEYGTTFLFLEYFGLADLADLPPVDDFAAVAEAATATAATPPVPGDDASHAKGAESATHAVPEADDDPGGQSDSVNAGADVPVAEADGSATAMAAHRNGHGS